MMSDTKFLAFVDNVSPKKSGGVQPVFLAEAIAVLQLLWELYTFFKDKGCFTQMKMRTLVKQAMKEPTAQWQEAALEKLKVKYAVVEA